MEFDWDIAISLEFIKQHLFTSENTDDGTEPDEEVDPNEHLPEVEEIIVENVMKIVADLKRGISPEVIGTQWCLVTNVKTYLVLLWK